MGTITRRPRKDGSTAYMAQVRLKREGRVIFDRTRSFDREQAAKAWIARTEKEMARPGAIEAERSRKNGATVAELIDRYLATSRKEIGKTKAQVLAAIRGHEIGQTPAQDLTRQDLVDYAAWLGQGRKPQTVQNYLSHLSAVLRVARTGFGVEIDRDLMADARDAARDLGLVARSQHRDRRPTLEEIDRLMAHFTDRSQRRNALPMHRVIAFAIFSTRRQEEITRITWRDLEPGRVLVRDMKNPGEKAGNHVWCELVPEAEAVARAMPQVSERIFPFTVDAVSAGFTRACKLLGIEDLHFHDLRHEGVSRLFEMGWTIPKVAGVSGHRSWQSLQRYAHLRETGDRWAEWPWLAGVTAP